MRPKSLASVTKSTMDNGNAIPKDLNEQIDEMFQRKDIEEIIY
jgi:hypothetical protein